MAQVPGEGGGEVRSTASGRLALVPLPSPPDQWGDLARPLRRGTTDTLSGQLSVEAAADQDVVGVGAPREDRAQVVGTGDEDLDGFGQGLGRSPQESLGGELVGRTERVRALEDGAMGQLVGVSGVLIDPDPPSPGAGTRASLARAP